LAEQLGAKQNDPKDFIGAAQAKVRSEAHFSFAESFRFPLGNSFLLAPNTICKKI